MVSASRLCGTVGVCVAALTATLSAQLAPRLLSIDAIYDPEQRIDFAGAPPTNLRWIDDTSYLQFRRTGRGLEWLKVDALSGGTSPLFDVSRMETALAKLPGITPEQASGLARSTDLVFNPSRTGTLVTIDNDLYFYDFVSSLAS